MDWTSVVVNDPAIITVQYTTVNEKEKAAPKDGPIRILPPKRVEPQDYLLNWEYMYWFSMEWNW